MIRYALTCSDGHAFEAWFRSAEDFDRQQERGMLSCPTCGDGRVSKALMAPAVVSRPAAAEAEAMPVAALPPPQAPVPPQMQEAIRRLRELKAQLLANAEDVGKGFAEEARRIHYGEAPARAVHGQASADEARALLEEGVGILPLPVLPEERN